MELLKLAAAFTATLILAMALFVAMDTYMPAWMGW